MTSVKRLNPTEQQDTARAAYADGLHRFADGYAADPNMPRLSTGEFLIFAHTAAEFAAIAPLIEDPLPGLDHDSNYQFHLHGRIRGLSVVVYAAPGDACEKTASRLVPQHDWSYEGVPVPS